MLIYHADAKPVRVPWRDDSLLASANQDAALVQRAVTDDALYQRALTGAVLAEQGVYRTGAHFHRDITQGTKAAKGFAGADGFQTKRSHDQLRFRQSMSMAESPIAPNTPPCILTMLSAAK